MFCPRCGTKVHSNKVICGKCQYTGKELLNNCGYGMKWYKFLINFALIASGVLYILDAIGYMSGTGLYANEDFIDITQKVYQMYPGLQTLDIVIGALFLVLGIWAILLRGSMAKFEKSAPLKMIILCAGELLIVLLYAVVAEWMIGVEGALSDNVFGIVWGVVYLILNYTYFKNRKELFDCPVSPVEEGDEVVRESAKPLLKPLPDEEVKDTSADDFFN